MLHKVVQHFVDAGVIVPRSTVTFWSDGGPHYRSRIQTSNVGYWMPEAFNIHTNQQIGMEYHTKGEVDGYFGVLSRRLMKATETITVSKCEQLCAILQKTAKADEWIDIAIPSVTREEYIRKHVPVTAASLPLPIKATHSYSFKHRDKRRPGLLGFDRRTITGIKAVQNHNFSNDSTCETEFFLRCIVLRL